MSECPEHHVVCTHSGVEVARVDGRDLRPGRHVLADRHLVRVVEEDGAVLVTHHRHVHRRSVEGPRQN